MAASLAFLPAAACALARRHHRPVIAVATVAIAAAEVGGRYPGIPRLGDAPRPVWILERAVCSWIALGARCSGGVTYAGRRILTAAHSTRSLRRRR